jgi:hypothetical protein
MSYFFRNITEVPSTSDIINRKAANRLAVAMVVGLTSFGFAAPQFVASAHAFEQSAGSGDASPDGTRYDNSVVPYTDIDRFPTSSIRRNAPVYQSPSLQTPADNLNR